MQMRFFIGTYRNTTLDSSLGDNQTEIIYSVFVNGLPVWAVIAASDMQLLSRADVSDIVGMPVLTVAERM